MILPVAIENPDMIPRADDAELALVGSMVLDRDALEEVIDLVAPRDFYDERCGLLYRAVREVFDSGRPVDGVLVYEWLRSRKLLDAAGGAKFIADAFHAPPSSKHAIYYAQQVAHAATLRAAILAGTEIARDAIENQHEPQAVLGRAETKLAGLLDRSIRKGPESLSDVLVKAVADISARHQPDYEPATVALSIPAVDAILAGGLRRGQLAILAARPGVGKSALASQAALAASERGNPVLFVSLEMSGRELAERMIAQESLVAGMDMREGRLSISDQTRVARCAAEISTRPLSIEDRGSLTFRELSAVARRMTRRDGLGLLVVDYLQLMEPDDRRVPREQQVAQISRSLKLLAKDLDIPVLCLCQMSREAEKQGREPRLSDLRESGAIEQDADVVIFLHKLDQYDDDAKAELVKVIVAKQRSGPRAEVVVLWHKRHCKFVEKAAERYKEFDGFNAARDPYADEVT